MLIVCPACATGYDLAAEVIGGGRVVRCTACRYTWLSTPEPFGELPATGVATASAPASGAPDPDEVPWTAEAFDPSSPVCTPFPVTIGGAAEELGSGAAFGHAPKAFGPAAEAFGPTLDSEPAIEAPDAMLTVEHAARARRMPRPKPDPAWRPRHRGQTFAVVRGFAALGLGAALAFGGVAVPKREAVVKAVPDLAGLYALAGLPVNVRGLEFRRVVGHNEIEDGLPVLAVEGAIANVTARMVEMPPLRLALRGARQEEIYAWIVEPPKGAASPGESVRFRARLPAPPAEARDVVVRFAREAELKLGMRQ